jgi:hypothetical protein
MGNAKLMHAKRRLEMREADGKLAQHPILF